MGLRVDSAAVEFPLDVSVPIVFDFVIGSSGQPCGNQRPSERKKRKRK